MKNKTLIKTKIVLEEEGTSIVVYFWKKIFWIFGYWYPNGCSSSTNKVSKEKLDRINDVEVSKILRRTIIKGFV